MRPQIRVFTLIAGVLLLGVRVQAAGAGGRDRALQHFRIGQAHLRAEKWDKAELAFSRAIAHDPLLVLAHYGRGQALMAVRRYREAIRAYVACREAFERTVEIWLGERRSAERSRNDARELERALGLDNGSARRAAGEPPWRLEPQLELLQGEATNLATLVIPAPLSLALGSAYFRSGDLRMAELEYRAAIAADSTFGAAHNNLAVLCLMTGRLTDAEDEVRLALAHGFPVAPGLREDIREAMRPTR